MLRQWRITPFVNPATEAQVAFKTPHCSTRSTMERRNSVLKRRWHCLHSKLRYTPTKASHIIAACVVLHNWAIDLGTPMLGDDHQDDGPDVGGNGMSINEEQHATLTGKATRNAIVQHYFRS